MKLSFDFWHTCPEIDEFKQRFLQNVKRYLQEFAEDLSNCDDIEAEIELWSNVFAEDFSNYCEAVRRTNAQMREYAEKLIDEANYYLKDI